MKAEEVAIGQMIADRCEVSFETFRVGQLEVLAAGKVGNGFGDIPAQAVDRSNGGHFGERERGRELAETVIGLRPSIAWAIRVGMRVFTHAAVGRVGVVLFETQQSSRRSAGLGGQLSGCVMSRL